MKNILKKTKKFDSNHSNTYNNYHVSNKFYNY